MASEQFTIGKKQRSLPHHLSFVIPVANPMPAQLYLRAISDRWVGVEHTVTVSLRNLVLPEYASPMTDLLDLKPLPITALKDELYQAMYSSRFTYFNPI